MRKQLAIIGLSAGLVGGGAAGFALTGTSGVAGAQDGTTTTTAATSDSGSSSTASTAPTQSSSSSSSDSSTSNTTKTRPDPSTRIAATLKPLVDDGTITQAQADKVVAALAAAGPMGGDHGGRGGHGRGGAGLDAAATALGMTEDALHQQMEAGTTIAKIASDKGVDLKTVTDAMLDAEKQHLAQEVTDGELTQAQADQRLSGASDRITAMVNGQMPQRPANAPSDAPASSSAAPTTTAG